MAEDFGSKAQPSSGELIEQLSKVDAPEWDKVLEVFGQHEDIADGVLELVIAASAEKLGFWRPDCELLTACREALGRRLGHLAVKSKQASADDGTSEGAATRLSSKSPRDWTESRHPSESASDGSSGEATPDISKGQMVPETNIEEKVGVDTMNAEDPTALDPLALQALEASVPVQSMVRQFSPYDEPGDDDLQRQISAGTTPSAHLMKGGSLALAGTCQKYFVVEPELVAKAKDAVKAESFLIVANPAQSRLRQFKWALFAFVLMQMLTFAFYVVFYMTPETWDTIGVPIVIARGSAYGACFWTAVLFLTMSRDLISFVARLRCVRSSQTMLQLLNCYKELHIFSAYEVLLDGGLHALMHHVGTFVAFERYSNKELNEVFVCAKDKNDIPDGYIGKVVVNFLSPFQWPKCPLSENEDMGYFDGVLSTPGITGYLLLAVICLLGWFSRQKQRKANFRVFYILHQLLVPSWVLLLIVHGANDWVGLGFPLVILVAGIPVATYGFTRLRRNFLSYCSTVQVAKAEKSQTGKLLRLEVELPRGHCKCKVGQYAYINVPQIGWMEWHPYTISSCQKIDEERQVISFCIMSVGVWTNKLSTLFEDTSAKPKLSIDGPYYAPTVSMPNRSTVVGIGAGVGVTPFLSFMGSLAENKGGSHKNAHIFWMSAFATDFILFSDLLSEVDKLTASGGCNTSFHLHATPRFGPWDGKGLGCVFELLAKDVWETWKDRLAKKSENKLPVFCNYPKPIHGVVSTAVLDSEKPLAVAVGSPDFNAELLAIGDADEKEDVFVYFCGNPFLQNMVQVACASCNELRAHQGKPQRFFFYFERFG